MIKGYLKSKVRGLSNASLFLFGFSLGVGNLILGAVALVLALVLDFCAYSVKCRGMGASAPISASAPPSEGVSV